MLGRILVVDNDAETCELIQTTLSSTGIEALAVTDSAEAAKRLQREKFDCVFLAVVMPPPDGIELTCQMRRSGYNQSTPIVMICGDHDPSLLTRGYKAGANFFFYKPFERRCLLGVLRAAQVVIERERRRHRRVAVRRKVVVCWEHRKLEGETLDMSLNGLAVNSPGAFPPGSRVQVSLDLVPGGKPSTISGRVVRVLGEQGMGIQLDALSTTESERLQEFLLPLILAAAPREPRSSLA